MNCWPGRPASTPSCMRSRSSGANRPRALRLPRSTRPDPSMIKSMTGFASLTREGESATVTVTVKGGNHRFLDLQLRTPQSLAAVDGRLRAVVQQRIARGRIELAVTVQSRRQSVMDVEVNDAIIEALSAALDRARERGLVSGSLSPGDVLRFPQAVTVRERSEATEEDTTLPPLVESAVADALDELDRMRVSEGALLRADLDARRALLGDLFERAAVAAGAGAASLRGRLSAGGQGEA